MKAVIFIHVLYIILIITFMVKGAPKCESKVELRAVLISCPVKDSGCDDDDPLSQAMNSEEAQILRASHKNFESLREEKERGYPNTVRDCKRKLIITLKVKNVGKIACDDEYIIVDHVFDPVTGGKGRLLSPVILKLRQEQMIQLYGLHFQKVVSGQPFEEEKEPEKECSANPNYPTCGITMYNGKPIPFSEGFCCSCDPFVNAKRQLSPISEGDTFLYKDSKLISQGNGRYVRDEKSSIVNPELVQIQYDQGFNMSGNSMEEGVEDGDDEGDEECPISSLLPEKFPNFLLENDRKIVCEKGDFMSELCQLQNEKNKRPNDISYSSTNPISKVADDGSNLSPEVNNNYPNNNNRIQDSSSDIHLNKNSEYTISAADSKINPNTISGSSKNNFNGALILNNLFGAIKADHASGRDSLHSKRFLNTYDQERSNQITRGKRENTGQESISKSGKKLSLEEKLEKFLKSKNHLTNRRKRLLELSHKRFRKADVNCQDTNECKTILVTNFPDIEDLKTLPPKYFFAHDKFVLDPLNSNSSIKSLDEFEYEDITKETKNDDCEKENVGKIPNQDDIFLKSLNRFQKTDTKSRGKGKPRGNTIGKSDCKKGRLPNLDNVIREKIKVQNYGSSHKEKAILRNDKKFKINKEKESEDRDESEIEAIEKDNNRGEDTDKNNFGEDSGKHKFQKDHFNPKNLKSSSVFKTDKKSERPKMRTFFTIRNREKQILRSELNKNRKKPEVEMRENMEVEKFKGKKFEETFQENTKENRNKEKVEGNKDIDEKKENLLNPLENDNEHGRPNLPIDEFSQNVDMNNLKKKEDLNKKHSKLSSVEGMLEVKRKHLKTIPKVKVEGKSKESRPFDDGVRDVDFKVEIIRNQYPEMFKPRRYPYQSDQFISNRVNPPREHIESKVYNLVNELGSKTSYKNRQNPLIYNKPPQKYYIVENDRYKSPRGVYFIDGQSPLIEVKNHPYYIKGPEKSKYSDQIFREYEPARTSSRLQSKYETYLYRKPTKHYHTPLTDYRVFNKGSNLQKFAKQNFITNQNNIQDKPFKSAFVGKKYPDVFFQKYDNFPTNVRYNSYSVDEDKEDSESEKVRIRRNAGYFFEPARGFFSSELEYARNEGFKKFKNAKIVHELESCQPERSVRRSEDFSTWGDKIMRAQFSQSNHDNLSYDSQIISNLQKLQNKPVSNSRKELEFSSEMGNNEELKRKAKMARDKERLIRSYLNAPDYVLKELASGLKEKRQADDEMNDKGESSRNENCNKYSGPEEVTQDTAHCMRFGDLWYSVYLIKKPVVAQIVGIQLFDKHSFCDGTSQWRDLTKGKMVRVGTFLPKAEDELPSISFTYMGGKAKKMQSAIDADNYLLLIPSHISDSTKAKNYPQFEGGPSEYLLVDSKDVSSGGDCNMVGTSFEAFARQPDRCSHRKGSCLKRQPSDLWREDMEARINGKRGKYFLENFGTVPNSPIRTYTNFSGEFLALEYYGDYTSTIEIEVKADYNAIIRKGSNAQIPSVYIDSTYPKKTRIILSVLNIGLTSSYFRPRLGDCPPDLDPSWCPLEGSLVTIPPQQRHDFKLDLSGVLPPNKIYATVQILNQLNKKIAYRKIIIKKGNRCVCAFHCKCNCLGANVDNRACHRLSLEEYRGAGYIGSFPFRGGAATSASESIMGNINIVFITACYVLLFFGVLKGVLGIFNRPLGIAGTKLIVGPRRLTYYYEYDLNCYSVLFDECGFPVHPTTNLPVQIVPLWLEVILNFFFFFLYPLRGIWFLILSSPCCKTVCADCDGCCHHNEEVFEGEHNCSSPLLSKNPQPTTFNYNLTTMHTKKEKAEEYLSYLPYKGDDDPLEEDDTEFVLQEMKRYRKK